MTDAVWTTPSYASRIVNKRNGKIGTITVRLHGNNDNSKPRFNRTENLRAVPPDDPDFDR